ncbi:hypothetical protein GA0061083_2324 [Pseudarthrobacter enclensis]|uniref:Uncharacterized protein n=1 Tax=Pseudarthrobacter enclensis TaxID=993070 RepID=A0A0V8IQB6_9MICC|nr:hypothetical protein [Pseudarthrobacter enclensis]KSU76905.1 hypothetical protein AS031_09980 [Pseudarthrobacter enclensis]SCC04747.1 hypothetical protein GA0061083_2324 [Pseudarthrobacter enclensis]
MSEHRADEEPRKAGSAPGMEGEGGQYMDGDYGEAGAVEVPSENLEDGEYPDGDYGEAGAVRGEDAVREGLTDGQVQATDEERGPLHGR